MHREANRWVEATVGSTVIAVHLDDPVATVDAIGRDRLVASWSDLNGGRRSVTSTVLAGPSGVWVVYRPMESEDLGFPEGDAAAIHVAVDGSVTRFTMLEATQPVGATSHGLWLTPGEFPDPNDATEWLQRRRFSVLATGGNAHSVVADRNVAFVFDEQASAHLVVYDGPPDADRDGRGATYEYRYAVWPVPARSRCRRARRSPRRGCADEGFGDHGARRRGAVIVSARTGLGYRPALACRSGSSDRIREARTRQPRQLLACARRENVAALARTRGPARRTHRRMATDAGRSVVHASLVSRGSPAPHAQGIRRRRTCRPALYAAIHLMEDLDTRAFPEPKDAQDGVLDI